MKFIDFEKLAALFLKYWDKFLIDGVEYTLALAAITVAFGTVFASVLALMKMSKIRSGIQAVDPGQKEAALSLGFSDSKAMWFVVVPQAVKNILPALGNEFIMIIKDTSLGSTFFIGDLMTQYLVVKGATYLPIEPLVIVGVIYFIMTFVLSKVFGHFEKKLQRADRHTDYGHKRKQQREAVI